MPEKQYYEYNDDEEEEEDDDFEDSDIYEYDEDDFDSLEDYKEQKLWAELEKTTRPREQDYETDSGFMKNTLLGIVLFVIAFFLIGFFDNIS